MIRRDDQASKEGRVRPGRLQVDAAGACDALDLFVDQAVDLDEADLEPDVRE